MDQTSPTPIAAPQGENTKQHAVRFHGRGAEYFGIWIVNILLTIITLGIYSAWAKVRTKRYFYGNTELDENRFDYLATPVQILIGRIIAVVLVSLWAWMSSFEPLAATLLLVALGLVFPVLMVRNLRFDMRMTRYRNIRFNFVASYKEAYKVFLLKPAMAYLAMLLGIVLLVLISKVSSVLAGLLSLPLLFIGGPVLFAWVNKHFSQFIVQHTYYGNQRFDAQLDTRKFASVSLKTLFCGVLAFLVLSIVLVLIAWAGGMMSGLAELSSSLDQSTSPKAASGFISVLVLAWFVMIVVGFYVHAYYFAHIRNYVFSQTRLEQTIQLRSAMTPMGFAMLIITNLLMVICSLGLARPWAAVRYNRYLSDATAVEGDLSLAAAQDTNDEQSSAIADEVTQAFDLDIGII